MGVGVVGQGLGVEGRDCGDFHKKGDEEFVGILKNNLILGHNSSSLPSPEKYITFSLYPVYHL